MVANIFEVPDPEYKVISVHSSDNTPAVPVLSPPHSGQIRQIDRDLLPRTIKHVSMPARHTHYAPPQHEAWEANQSWPQTHTIRQVSLPEQAYPVNMI